jgi:dihydroorotate dehydrogenase (fumarate)
VIKYLLAGADVVMTASALIRHGPAHAAVLLDGLSGWMTRKGYPSVAAVRGMLALPAGTDQPAYERAGYVRAMQAANSSPGPW